MKAYRTAIAVFLIAFAIACNNNKNKKNDMSPSDAEKPASEYSNNENKDQFIQKELKQAENIVKEILTTSPRYKELTKSLNKSVVENGGISFELILERSPDQDQDNSYLYSQNYEFAIYENYTERQLISARFTFNPKEKHLYEYDAISDQLRTIEFNRNLLIKYDSVLKNQ